jgi:hypothetical protein
MRASLPFIFGRRIKPLLKSVTCITAREDDIYALGLVCVELVTGKHLYELAGISLVGSMAMVLRRVCTMNMLHNPINE